ncbi:hypothetical protein HYV84_07855 [Candidatus Woesearchaeota archaeon]|nr:hypothetical protein [Candidatus Woesearchaeota archaeon]
MGNNSLRDVVESPDTPSNLTRGNGGSLANVRYPICYGCKHTLGVTAVYDPDTPVDGRGNLILFHHSGDGAFRPGVRNCLAEHVWEMMMADPHYVPPNFPEVLTAEAIKGIRLPLRPYFQEFGGG